MLQSWSKIYLNHGTHTLPKSLWFYFQAIQNASISLMMPCLSSFSQISDPKTYVKILGKPYLQVFSPHGFGCTVDWMLGNFYTEWETSGRLGLQITGEGGWGKGGVKHSLFPLSSFGNLLFLLNHNDLHPSPFTTHPTRSLCLILLY